MILSKPIYDFDKADVIIGDTSIIVLGKNEQFGAISYASPVEIVASEKQTRIAGAELINWFEERGRIVIDIKDQYYTEPFKIEFKDHLAQIKFWLTHNFTVATPPQSPPRLAAP